MRVPATDLHPEASSKEAEELIARVRRLQIRAKRLVRLLFAGEYHSVFRGRGIEFSDVREYIPGDEVRTIDWNVTARMGTTFIKKFVEERELTIYLLVDVSPSAEFTSGEQTKRDLAAEIATVLAFAAAANNDRVGAIVFSDRVEHYLRPRKGAQHVLRLARDLIHLEPHGRGTDLGSAVDLLMRVAKRPGVAFILSDFHTSGFEASLRLAAQKHDIVAISLTDVREVELPRAGLVLLHDSEAGGNRLIDTEDRREREAYSVSAVQRVLARRRLLSSLGVEEIAVRTDSSYIHPLMAFFKGRAKRRRSA
jgi:uncharacterized protein (DUF58 family)